MLNNNSNLKTNTASLQELLNAVNNLPEASNGVELPELTNEGSAENLLSGKQLIDGEGKKVTGTMPNNGTVTQTFDGLNTSSVTIPAGYTSGGTIGLDNTISNEANEQSSLIDQIIATANSLPNVEGGNNTTEIKLQNKTVTPTKNSQIITADTNYDGLDTVTVNGDENLVAENIAEGISIFGVEGSLSGNSSGYTLDDFNGSTISGSLTVNGTKVRAYAFYGFKKVTSISAPNATALEQHAFGYCTAATSINLPEVITIANGALRNCHALTSIVLPKATTITAYGMAYLINAITVDLPACTSLDTYALGYAYKLQHLILRSTTVCTLKNVNCFANSPMQAGKEGGYVYVPNALISEYQTATNWSGLAVTFRAIEDYPDICGV